MRLSVFKLILLILVTLILGIEATVIRIIRDNVIGPAVNFQTFPLHTDPDEGLRRRREYEAINGRFGFKHVERLGLGEDGRMEERRIQQMLRDEAGTLSYQPPNSGN